MCLCENEVNVDDVDVGFCPGIPFVHVRHTNGNACHTTVYFVRSSQPTPRTHTLTLVHTHSHTHSHTLAHTLAHTHTHTHSLTHSLTHSHTHLPEGVVAVVLVLAAGVWVNQHTEAWSLHTTTCWSRAIPTASSINPPHLAPALDNPRDCVVEISRRDEGGPLRCHKRAAWCRSNCEHAEEILVVLGGAGAVGIEGGDKLVSERHGLRSAVLVVAHVLHVDVVRVNARWWPILTCFRRHRWIQRGMCRSLHCKEHHTCECDEDKPRAAHLLEGRMFLMSRNCKNWCTSDFQLSVSNHASRSQKALLTFRLFQP